MSGDPAANGIVAAGQVPGVVGVEALDPAGGAADAAAGTRARPVGGDLGGIYNIHFDGAPFTVNGKSIRVKNVMHLLSPLNYRVASTISVDGGPYTNLGTPWWRKNP